MRSLLSLLVLDERLRRPRYHCALLLYAAIVLMGSIPGARAELGTLASGIALHTLAYGALTFLLYTGTAGTRRARAVRTVLTVFAMGAADELVQSLLPYRSGALADWVIDANAAVVTAGLLWAFLPDPVASRQP